MVDRFQYVSTGFMYHAGGHRKPDIFICFSVFLTMNVQLHKLQRWRIESKVYWEGYYQFCTLASLLCMQTQPSWRTFLHCGEFFRLFTSIVLCLEGYLFIPKILFFYSLCYVFELAHRFQTKVVVDFHSVTYMYIASCLTHEKHVIT